MLIIHTAPSSHLKRSLFNKLDRSHIFATKNEISQVSPGWVVGNVQIK